MDSIRQILHKRNIILSGAGLLLIGVAAAISLFATSGQSHTTPAQDTAVQKLLQMDADDYATYSHPSYGFSFRYPSEFIVSHFDEENGEIVLVENPGVPMGFQIFVSPFDEAGPITKERIARDIPSLGMEGVVEFLLDDDTPALRFSSTESPLGETREMWFIRNGNLYQVSMYAENEEWLDAWIRQLANNLRFEDL